MARYRRSVTPAAMNAVVPEEHDSSIDLFEDTTKPKPEKKSKRNPFTTAAMQQASVDLDQIIEDDAWESAKPIHFIVVFWRMHEWAYGVLPSMTANDRRQCAFLTSRILKVEFGGKPRALSEFIRWVWVREKGREKWRRENKRDAMPLSWRFMYSAAVITDYRIAVARKQGH